MGIKSTANAELWATRVQDFMNSGIIRKEWCQEHQLFVSTLGYWIRKRLSLHPTGAFKEYHPKIIV